jgi:hypothetical protein
VEKGKEGKKEVMKGRKKEGKKEGSLWASFLEDLYLPTPSSNSKILLARGGELDLG